MSPPATTHMRVLQPPPTLTPLGAVWLGLLDRLLILAYGVLGFILTVVSWYSTPTVDVVTFCLSTPTACRWNIISLTEYARYFRVTRATRVHSCSFSFPWGAVPSFPVRCRIRGNGSEESWIQGRKPLPWKLLKEASDRLSACRWHLRQRLGGQPEQSACLPGPEWNPLPADN